MHNFIDNKIRIIQIRSEKSKNCHGISLWINNLDKKVSREFSKKNYTLFTNGYISHIVSNNSSQTTRFE
jgi:hypothetical protein